MDLITPGYLIGLAAGAVWVIVRVAKYVQAQRRREQEWHQILPDDQFREYLAELKDQTADKSRSNDTNPPQEPPPSVSTK